MGNTLDNQLKLKLYVTSSGEAAQRIVHSIEQALIGDCTHHMLAIEVVDVLATPELALQSDVFITPTLIRELPQPEIRVLGDFSNIPHVIKTIGLGVSAGQRLLVAGA